MEETGLGSLFDAAGRFFRRARPGRFGEDLPQGRALDDVVLDSRATGVQGQVYLAEYRRRTLGVYRTYRQETYLSNDIGASIADEELGLGLVPRIMRWDGPKGAGTLQEYVENDGPALLRKGPESERHALLDYVIGSGDRHRGSCLRRTDGGSAAIDNVNSFPVPRADRYGVLRSDQVVVNLGRPLSPEVVAQARAVDVTRFTERLRAAGISDPAVDGAVQRLMEVRTHGMITGENWGSMIMDSGFRVHYPPGIDNLDDWIARFPLSGPI